MKQLTRHQIDQLFAFTQKHYVEHYDLQSELVDHLANDIEHIWEEQPQLLWEEVLNLSFRKFGVFGFMTIIDERQKAMQKRYWTILKRHMFAWFSLPKLLLTVLLFYGILKGIQMPLGRDALSVVLLILGGAQCFWAFKLNINYQKRAAQNGRKWMLEDVLFKIAQAMCLMLISNVSILINSAVMELLPFYGLLLVAAVLTLVMLFSYISVFVLPKRVDSILANTYSEYNLVQNCNKN